MATRAEVGYRISTLHYMVTIDSRMVMNSVLHWKFSLSPALHHGVTMVVRIVTMTTRVQPPSSSFITKWVTQFLGIASTFWYIFYVSNCLAESIIENNVKLHKSTKFVIFAFLSTNLLSAACFNFRIHLRNKKSNNSWKDLHCIYMYIYIASKIRKYVRKKLDETKGSK